MKLARLDSLIVECMHDGQRLHAGSGKWPQVGHFRIVLMKWKNCRLHV